MPLKSWLPLLALAVLAAAPLSSQTLTAGPEILVAAPNYLYIREAAPAIAPRAAGGFLSLWRDGPAINTRAFSAADAPLSAARQLSTHEEDAPRLAALASGGFVAAWTHFERPVQPPVEIESIVVVQLLDTVGNRLSPPLEVGRGTGVTGFTGYPAVAAEPGGGFVVTWTSAGRILARRFNALGVPVGGEVPVSPSGLFSAVAVVPGGFAVAWSGPAGDLAGVLPQVFVQAFTAEGTPSGPATVQVAADGFAGPEVSISADAEGRFVAAWTESANPYRVLARRFSPGGQPLGDPILAATTPNGGIGAYLGSVAARPDGSFLVVWGEQSTISGGPANQPASTLPVGGDVKARAFNAAGEALGPAFLVHDGAAGEQHEGRAVADSGGWLVTWMQRLDGSRVAARRLTLTCGSATVLCLKGDRFRAEVAWRVPATGAQGTGTPIPLTGDTGSFWFFNPANYELAVKVLDGRGLNGHFWVFYASLTDVEFDLTVTDTLTGRERTYHNPAGTLASHADTLAFPE